jgi:hypothetical protein
MGDFLATSFSYPTVVLTVLLSVGVIFWLASLLGLGTEEGELELDAPGGDGLSSTLAFLHLDGAPLTISLTLWALFSWFTCFVASALTGLSGPDGALEVALATAVLVLSLVVGLVPAALIARPVGRGMRRLSGSGTALGSGLVGRSCRITTRTVTTTFGQAVVTLADGTTDTIQVRAAQADSDLAYDDVALVIDFDADDRSYLVEPAPAFLGGNADTRPSDPRR